MVVVVGGGDVVVVVVVVGGGDVVVEEVVVEVVAGVVVGLAALAVVGVATGATVLEQAVARTAKVKAFTHRCPAIRPVCPPTRQNWRRLTEAGLIGRDGFTSCSRRSRWVMRALPAPGGMIW